MADDVDEMVAALEHELETVVVDLVVEMLANLREDTPVDTGHARANWVASKGSPLDSEVSTRSGASSRGDAEILAYKLVDGDAFVANNVDYIVGPGSLNDGHSSQAAAGFIEAAVSRAIASVWSSHGYAVEFGVVVTGAMRGL